MRAASSTPNRLLKHLSRRTTTGRFIPEIDGMRFVAIALVVLSHIDLTTVGTYYGGPKNMPSFAHLRAGSLVTFLDRGWVGVYLFFVISGFILGLPFASHSLAGGRKVNLTRYYLRRLTRLEPPYLVALVGSFLLLIAVGSVSWSDVHHYTWDVPYLHSIRYGGVLLIFWTLEIEVQFYLVVPLLAKLFTIRDKLVRRSLILGGILAGGALHQWWHGAPFHVLTLPFYISFFLAGFLLADIWLLDWKEKPAKSGGWDFGGAVAVIVIFALIWGASGARGYSDLAGWLLPLATIPLFIGAFRGPLLNRLLSNRWIYTIGGMCYSMYLTHVVVLAVSRWAQIRLGNPLTVFDSYLADLAIQTILGIPLVLATTAAFFVLIERPCMNPEWPNRLARPFRR